MSARAGTFFAATAGAAVVLALAGCALPNPAPTPTAATRSTTPPTTAPHPSASPAEAESLGPPGGPGCAPASPVVVRPDMDGVEVQGTSDAGNSLYGLVHDPVPLTASNSTSTIDWRITGSGDLTVAVTKPNGTAGKLAWGPAIHSQSDYVRPGDEWGTGVIFDEPGCWTLDFVGGGAHAAAYLLVAPGAPAG